MICAYGIDTGVLYSLAKVVTLKGLRPIWVCTFWWGGLTHEVQTLKGILLILCFSNSQWAWSWTSSEHVNKRVNDYDRQSIFIFPSSWHLPLYYPKLWIHYSYTTWKIQWICTRIAYDKTRQTHSIIVFLPQHSLGNDWRKTDSIFLAVSSGWLCFQPDVKSNEAEEEGKKCAMRSCISPNEQSCTAVPMFAQLYNYWLQRGYWWAMAFI